MNKKNIVYISQMYFLDSSLETVRCIKNDFDIHFIIEITPDSLHSTVLDFQIEKICSGFNNIKDILTDNSFERLIDSFSGLKSIYIYYINSKKSVSLNSIIHSIELSAFIIALKPFVIHFDSASLRLMFSLPWLYNIPKVLTIHDPVPHSGEWSWKHYISFKLYLLFSSSVVLYSLFSKQLFDSKYCKYKFNSNLLKLLPYNYIANKSDPINHAGSYILFFGRLSYYKGIDLLLNAIPEILSIYPEEKFVIAGRPEHGFLLDTENNSVQYILKYLEVDELKKLITNAKFVVCPYRDATQSGVLMTCFALNRSVIATNVGSFNEYISDSFNGLLCNPDIGDLAKSIIKALNNDFYQTLNQNISKSSFYMDVRYNNIQLKNIYDYKHE